MVCLVVAVFLAASGAFGTGFRPFIVRLGFWVMSISIGAGFGLTFATLFSRWGWLDGPVWRDVGILTLAISTPLIGVSWVLTSVVFDQARTLGTLLGIAAPVLIITLATTVLNVLTARSWARREGRPDRPDAAIAIS